MSTRLTISLITGMLALAQPLTAAAQGYADVVRVLYGYDPACACIVGMTVLESKETPGLGDKIDTDPDFLLNFKSENKK